MEIRILIEEENDVEEKAKDCEADASEADDELDEQAAAFRVAAIESWVKRRDKLCSFIREKKLSPRPILETLDLILFCYCAGYSDALIDRMKPNVGEDKPDDSDN